MTRETRHIPDGTERFSPGVRANQLQLLYNQSFPAVFISNIAALLLTTILWSFLEKKVLLLWFGAVIATTIIRLILFIAYFRTLPDETAILKWETPYGLTLTIAALIWGVGVVVIMPNDSLLHQVIIYFFLIGMAGGALSVYSAIRKFALITISALLLPATIWFLTRNELIPICLGLGGTIFFLSAIRATKVLSKTLRQSFLMTHALTEAREKAEWLARTDPLTKLNNRRAFYDIAESQILYCRRYAHPISVIILDIDFFKQINDLRGHADGDLALQQLGTILHELVRNSDFSGRLGGEEFAILLPNTDSDGAYAVAEKLRSRIESSPIDSPNGEFSVTASIGVATGDEDIDQLIHMADTAMYRAKESGKNRVIRYDSIVNTGP